MSNHNRPMENGNSQPYQELPQEIALGSAEQKPADAAGPQTRYPDVQSAMRFPIKLPVSLKSSSGESLAETENISANGVLFQVDSDMPVGSMVDFSISLPAEVVGTPTDVRVDCRGRVVRSVNDDGRHGVGVVIDEYHFERR
jgi:hypothetical protein